MNQDSYVNPQHKLVKYPFIALILTFACVVLYTLFPPVSLAGKEGVFITPSVYFTLEEVALSKGDEYQTLQFRVLLNNDGGETVDFNRFGVRVWSADGRSYYAQLTEKAEALVKPYSAESYSFLAKVAQDVPADQLMVNFFDRKTDGSPDFGSLSIDNALTFQQNDHQLVFSLADADSAVTGNAFATVQAIKAFSVPVDGRWKVTLDAQIKVSGVTGWNPASLRYALADSQGRSFTMTMNSVETTQTDQATTTRMLLTTTLDEQPALDSLSLEIDKSGTNGANIGSIGLQSLFSHEQANENVGFTTQGKEGVSLSVTKAEEIVQSGKRQAVITAHVQNGGKRTIAYPTLAGTLVFKDEQLSLATETITGTNKYIAPGESGTIQFAAELPDEFRTGAYEFYVSEQKSSVSASQGSTGNAGSGASSASAAVSSVVSMPVAAIRLDAGLSKGASAANAPQIALGEPFVFTADNKAVDSDIEVSLVEINAHTNADNGFQTVVAKLKFYNKGTDTIPLPTFATELQDLTGTTYPGTKQTTALSQLIPKTAYVYSYSYLLPPTKQDTFKLNILEHAGTTNGLQLPIASYQVAVHQSNADDPVFLNTKLAFFPYTVGLNYWSVSSTYNNGNYTYKLLLNLDIAKESSVLVDDTFANLEFELADSSGRALGSSVQTLQGTNKLINGAQTISFTNVKTEQFTFPLSVRVYESIPTPNGTAKRLIATLKQ